MSEARFFPFNPKGTRLMLAAAAAGCLATTAWALYGLGGGGTLAEARAGIAAGLLLAFLYVRYRLRPREGWGVLLTPAELVVARPLSGDPAQLPWSSLAKVARSGKKREVLVLLLDGDRRLLLPRHLFPSAKAFEEVCAAVEERAPRPRFDA
ncbi:MAG: hypothetical protein ACYC8T_08120 [Myxococcaceae bacterium]